MPLNDHDQSAKAKGQPSRVHVQADAECTHGVKSQLKSAHVHAMTVNQPPGNFLPAISLLA